MSALLGFFVTLALLAVFVLAALVLIGVALTSYLLVVHAYYALRAKRRHARYVTKAYRRTGRVPAPIRTDIVVRP